MGSIAIACPIHIANRPPFSVFFFLQWNLIPFGSSFFSFSTSASQKYATMLCAACTFDEFHTTQQANFIPFQYNDHLKNAACLQLGWLVSFYILRTVAHTTPSTDSCPSHFGFFFYPFSSESSEDLCFCFGCSSAVLFPRILFYENTHCFNSLSGSGNTL